MIDPKMIEVIRKFDDEIFDGELDQYQVVEPLAQRLHDAGFRRVPSECGWSCDEWSETWSAGCGAEWVFPDGGPRPMTKFIRADLVDRLKWYEISHKPDCPCHDTIFADGKDHCTCGLTEVFKETE